ncbi:beta-ketoacyl synthase N-terminal-like domain-containing protein [Streptomyces cinnamoneus]|uniref:beta-ketoacyl synthase N-terminal-like domain-containing protein n=1 Tax=Streptomyces cinnamoneus TaxID=53446 RepID=UPI00379D1B34
MTADTPGPTGPVAVVGMAVTLPGAGDLDTYWRNIVRGTDAISDVPPGRLDPDEVEGIHCRRGGFVDDVAGIDPAAFGIMPDSVATTEPDQLIALRTAAAAIADAGGALPRDRSRAGVVLGRGGYLTAGLARLDQRVRTCGQLLRTLREVMPELDGERLAQLRTAFLDALGPRGGEHGIGLVPNFAASRVANRLDLRGPAYTVDAACASSLVAVDQAAGELRAGRCDVMLAGGVHHCHDITLWSVFAQLRALSPTQRIRPFHREADGVLMGEGTGVVVLKRLRDAQRDGDRVYAVVRGVGVASDGRTASLVNPDPSGQARAVRLAWAAAGLDPALPGALGLLEAHGTGTPHGDRAEMAMMAEVFGGGDGPADAVVGSVKSMIGHTMPAAGAAGLIKAALAVHHGVLPPTLHCDDPHPALLATRFRPLAEARPWEADVRRAGVDAFGFGGINAHVVLEEPPAPAARRPARPAALDVAEPEPLLRLAAADQPALAVLLDADDAALRHSGEPGPGPARLAVAGPTAKRLDLARKAVARGRPWGGRGDVWFAPGPLLGAAGGKTAFLFPGLEADFVPRVDDVARRFGLPRPGRQDARVGDVARHGAAVVGVGRLLTHALRRVGVTPDAVAGHSVGEWTAMVAGGMFADDEVDAFLRDFDPHALEVPGLAFAAFGAPAAQVRAALTDLDGVVLSHDNAPHQSVACGPDARVRALAARLRGEGVLGQVLPFESGFHTPMLAPHLGPIREQSLRFTLRPATVPVWSCTTAEPFPADESAVRELFVRHLLEPVRFRQLTEAMYAAGFRAFVQLGTGRLPSLVGDTLADRDHLAVAANSPRRSGLAQLAHVAAALWTAGAEPDFAALLGPRPGTRIDLGAGPVSLAPADRDRLRRTLRGPGGGASPLAAWAPGVPAAAELDALLTETASAAADVLAAAATAAPPVVSPAAPGPAVAPPLRTRVRVGVETMPYLLDHCFFPQRPGWPDLTDRWPVVPATTIVQHMTDAVAAAGTPVALRGARFLEWAVAAPPVDVDVTATAGSDGWYDVAFGRYARAEVRVADAYPAPPAPWPDPGPGIRPPLTAREMYDERWMFHGPLFRGVTAVTALGERHVRGVLTAPPAPGALLDNVGQLLGYWLMATHRERTVVFPVGFREAVFHGPHPGPGTALDCHIRITTLTDTTLEADAELARGHRVWARILGWQDRRFDSTPGTDAVHRRPDRRTLSTEQPGGWQLLFDRWPDPASRELTMRNQLAGEERTAYAAHPPRGRRQWLLGRIAAKDAVRRHLWDHGGGPVFPGEIRIHDDAAGRPRAGGRHGRRLPPLALSLAHSREAAVALVRPAGTPAGIGIEEVPEGEPADPGNTPLHRAAARAAAAAEGTALPADPRGTALARTGPDRLTARTPSGRTYTVRLTRTGNPPGLPPRTYVVAWTEENEEQHP